MVTPPRPDRIPAGRPYPPGDSRPKGRTWFALFAAIASTTVGTLPVFLTGSLAPQISRELAFPASSLGIAVSAFFASAALCSVTLGRLSDRLGGRTMMRLGLLPAAAGSLAIGLGVHDPGQLTAALVLSGVSNGAVQPAANRHLARTIGEHRQGFAFGVKQAAIPCATLLAGLAVPALAHTAGWRWAFIGLAILACCVAALIPWHGTDREHRSKVTRADRSAKVPYARFPLIALAVGLGFGLAAGSTLGSFFVSSAVHAGASDSMAGIVAAAGSVASMSMRLFIGFHADRREGGHLRLVAALAAAGCIGLILLALGLSWLLVVAAIVGYGLGWGWAGLFNFAVVRSHPAMPGKATGITQAGGGAGACFGPLVFAFIVDHAGYRVAWLYDAALLLIAAVIFLVGSHALHAAGRVHRRSPHP